MARTGRWAEDTPETAEVFAQVRARYREGAWPSAHRRVSPGLMIMAEHRLTHRESERLLARIELAARLGPAWAQRWDAWERECGQCECWVEFPLGELTNPAVAGFVWAWAMTWRLTTHAIQRGDHFDAQGLEGKARVTASLTTALLVCRELPTYRCQIWEIIPLEHIRRSING